MAFPKILGITGGIGSGKSYVCNILEHIGIPVYNSDVRAREITHNNPEVLQAIRQEFGDGVFAGDALDRKQLASEVFGAPNKLAALNAIIHPAVGADFKQWHAQQTHPWVIKEAAILFETGIYQSCDATLLVTAPEALRVERVVARDSVTEEEVRARMANQWSDAKKQTLANYVVQNDGVQPLLPQLHEVLHQMAYSFAE